MKRLSVSILILTLFTSFAIAQGTGQKTDGQNQGMMMPHGNMGTVHGMGNHMSGSSMMYSMMVHHVIMKANDLDLTETQKKEIAGLNDKYLYPLVQKEADFRTAHMKVIDMMKDPNFDATALKTEIKSSNELNTDMADMMVDALASARKTLGPDNFKKCMTMDWKMTKSGTMQKGQMMQNQQAQ